jgi:hypothetical protein
MFPNLHVQTNEARVERAIARLRECTTIQDLDRVWANCQMLIDHLTECSVTEKGDRSMRLAKGLVNAKLDVQIDIELPRVAQSTK